MGKGKSKTKRDELLSALRTAEKQVAGLRDLLGLPPSSWVVETQKQIATFFGVSRHTIDSWRRTSPISLPGEPGNYDLKACFEWWLIHGPNRRGRGRPPKGGDEYDPLMDVDDDTPALERWRLARAQDAELSLAERRGQIVSVELFQGVMQAAFIPLRRFAEHQINEHGNGTADAWREAVELFGKEVEGVIGQSGDCDGASGDAAAVESTDSSATDADH